MGVGARNVGSAFPPSSNAGKGSSGVGGDTSTCGGSRAATRCSGALSSACGSTSGGGTVTVASGTSLGASPTLEIGVSSCCWMTVEITVDMLSTGRSTMATATRSIFPTTAHTLCAAGCGGGAAVYIPRLSCTTSRSRRRLMSLCVSNALSLFTVHPTRPDRQPRACAIHDAFIVSLFTAIYCYLLPSRPEHQYIKFTLVPVLPRHAPENMVGLCQGGHLWQTNHPFPSIIVLVRFRGRVRS